MVAICSAIAALNVRPASDNMTRRRYVRYIALTLTGRSAISIHIGFVGSTSVPFSSSSVSNMSPLPVGRPVVELVGLWIPIDRFEDPYSLECSALSPFAVVEPLEKLLLAP